MLADAAAIYLACAGSMFLLGLVSTLADLLDPDSEEACDLRADVRRSGLSAPVVWAVALTAMLAALASRSLRWPFTLVRWLRSH